jgi:hypothetical protein
MDGRAFNPATALGRRDVLRVAQRSPKSTKPDRRVIVAQWLGVPSPELSGRAIPSLIAKA